MHLDLWDLRERSVAGDVECFVDQVEEGFLLCCVLFLWLVESMDHILHPHIPFSPLLSGPLVSVFMLVDSAARLYTSHHFPFSFMSKTLK